MPEATDQMPLNSNCDCEQLRLALQEPLVVLRLAAYAMDAMRVLDRLQWHADRSGAFDQSIRAACPDWRNPGCMDDPAELITLVLAQATESIAKRTGCQSSMHTSL